MLKHLFKDRSGNWKQESFSISCDDFSIKYIKEPFLKEAVLLSAEGKEICQIDYYGGVDQISIETNSDREYLTEGEFIDFLIKNHPKIFKWFLWNLK